MSKPPKTTTGSAPPSADFNPRDIPKSSRPIPNRQTASSTAHQRSSSQPTTSVLVAKSSPAAVTKWSALEEDFGRRFDTTLANLRDGGFIGGDPTIPWGVMLPLREAHRPAFKLDQTAPKLPDRNSRQHIWDLLDLPPPVKPCLGPFQVAVPPWIDFSNLLFGDGGTMFASIGGLIPRDVTVAWTKSSNGFPNSLVVGPNPILTHDPESPTLKDGVHKVWRQVIHWLRLAQAGRPLRFSDFLRCFGTLNIGEDKSTVELMDDLFDACEAASRYPFATHVILAQAKKENLIEWTPEIHAHLKVPSSHAGILLRKWVLQLGEALAHERATAVFDLWGQHSPTEALL